MAFKEKRNKFPRQETKTKTHTINQIPVGENSYQNKRQEYSVDITFPDKVKNEDFSYHNETNV